MSEFVGEAAESTKVGAWLRSRRRAAQVQVERLSFADLVRLHKRWADAPEDGDAASAYGRALATFEEQQGRLEGAYWCSAAAGGAAVTVRGHLRRRHRFHRAAVWPGRADARVSSLLNECDELGVRVTEVLRGTGQRIAMGLVLRVAGNLLALADERAAQPERELAAEAAKREAANLADAQDYYRRAARRQAQLVYLLGMLAGVVALMAFVLAVLAVVHWTTNVRWIPHSASAGQPSLSTLYLCAIAGALGANVSVASRIDENAFKVDYELGRFTIAALGMLRPLLGAVFGIALYAALVSGLLDLFKVPEQDLTQQLYFFLVVAFLAGFSERWAKGVLTGIEGSGPPAAPPHVEPAKPRSGAAPGSA